MSLGSQTIDYRKQHRKQIVWICLLVLLFGIAGAFAVHEWRHHRALKAEYEPAPPGMILVPAGWFLMGSDDPHADPDERPLRKRFVNAFYIDRFEVTNRRYRAFKPDHAFPEGADELPVTFLLKPDVEAFCRWAGGRLPTGAEWEKAARGVDGLRYPWGNSFETNRANINPRFATIERDGVCVATGTNSPQHGLRAVGSFPQGASPYGCEDMAGNAWEWVADEWRDRNALGIPQGPARGVIRGGGFNYGPLQARSSHQGFEGLETTCHDVGFRVAMDAIPRRR